MKRFVHFVLAFGFIMFLLQNKNDIQEVGVVAWQSLLELWSAAVPRLHSAVDYVTGFAPSVLEGVVSAMFIVAMTLTWVMVLVLVGVAVSVLSKLSKYIKARTALTKANADAVHSTMLLKERTHQWKIRVLELKARRTATESEVNEQNSRRIAIANSREQERMQQEYS